MDINVFVPSENPPEDHLLCLTSMADGASARGHTVKVIDIEAGYSPCDVAVLFGVGKRSVAASHYRGQILYEHRFRRGLHAAIIERGFVKRDQYYGVAIGNLNGLGNFCNENSPADRWNALETEIKPWAGFESSEDKKIVVCGQVPWDASVQHTVHEQWCSAAVQFCQEHGGGREVIFRPHPLAADHNYGINPALVSKNTMQEDFDQAHVLVTFNSTTGALALLDGVPVIACDPGSMAFGIAGDLCTAHLEDPPKPVREQWAWDLAYCQWTPEEMAQGLPWERLEPSLAY